MLDIRLNLGQNKGGLVQYNYTLGYQIVRARKNLQRRYSGKSTGDFRVARQYMTENGVGHVSVARQAVGGLCSMFIAKQMRMIGWKELYYRLEWS